MSEAFKILCVDDEPDMEVLIRQKFRKEIRQGIYDIYFALNGSQALELLNEHQDIYLVLSDINMPIMDGLQLLNEIQKLDNHFIKVVMVSAYGDMQNIRTAMNRGAFDFINKPIDFDDFVLTVEKSKREIEMILQQYKTKKILEAVKDDLSAASEIQKALLPKLNGNFKNLDNLKVASYIKPARWGGGDFYDVFEIDKNRIGFIIADVSGKGISAAAFMLLSRTTVKIFSSIYKQPSEVLNAANNYLNIDNDNSMFVTLFYGVLNMDNNEFTYCNAGHNPPYLIHSDGLTVMEPTKNMALGVFENLPYSDIKISISKGDKVFLFTDGVSESMNEVNEEFGESRIEKSLSELHNESVMDIVSNMTRILEDYKGKAEQHDDITMLSFELI